MPASSDHRSPLHPTPGQGHWERGLLLHATPPPTIWKRVRPRHSGARDTVADHPEGQGPSTAFNLARGGSPSVVSAKKLGDPLMAGGRVAHGGSRFIRRLRMKPTRQMRGRDRRRGTWFDRELNCIAIEGVDFAQDTQEGGADRFELWPDSEQDEGGAKGSSSLSDDSEYVPETEPQDIVSVSRITDVENESGKVDTVKLEVEVQMDTIKLEKESVKVETESDTFVLSADVQMDTVKLDESAKVQMGSVRVSKVTGLCDNHGRLHLGAALREWRRAISDVQDESGKVDMESTKVPMDSVKLEESGKVKMDTIKLEDTAKQSAKVEIDSVKVEMDSGKELDYIISFSDIETDDETSWFQNGVDLRGHSQVEDDDINEQGWLIVFII